MKAGSGYTRWLLEGSIPVSIQIMNERMGQSSANFLTSNKLVTKNFSLHFSFLNSYEIKTEVVRVLKIIMINLRKKLPLIRAGVEAYEVPFLVIRNRMYCIEINLDGDKISIATLERYLEKIGFTGIIRDKKIPIIIQILEREALPTPIISIKIEGNSSALSVAQFLPLFLTIFSIPKIIEVLSTLHRKAVFNNGDGSLITDSPQPSSFEGDIGD